MIVGAKVCVGWWRFRSRTTNLFGEVSRNTYSYQEEIRGEFNYHWEKSDSLVSGIFYEYLRFVPPLPLSFFWEVFSE
jgi:hypothetical protein